MHTERTVKSVQYCIISVRENSYTALYFEMCSTVLEKRQMSGSIQALDNVWVYSYKLQQWNLYDFSFDSSVAARTNKCCEDC